MSSPPLGKFEEYLSLLRKRKARELDKQRRVSRNSTISRSSSISEFLVAKEEVNKLDLEFTEHILKSLSEALIQGVIPRKVYDAIKQEVTKYDLKRRQEFVVLKRQRKFVQEDLDDMRPSLQTVEDAYASVIVNKVMTATAKQKKRQFDQSAFQKAVLEYYDASRSPVSAGQPREAFCLLTGWRNSKEVKAAHIVPKSLKSDELSYLFGVGDAMLKDPRNGISLKHSLRDLDGKKLQFRNNNRPAKRFLYFRFIITYLESKNLGTASWVDRVEGKGTMWATPGPYLRKSMLLALARKISDHYLPPPLVNDNTFIQLEEESPRSPEDEDAMADSLKTRLDVRTVEAESDESEEDL
ncbi:MAG: hypothetical protein Q9202_005168 [Teloschistes flavicans]